MGWATKYPNSWWFPGASNTLWEGAYTVKKKYSLRRCLEPQGFIIVFRIAIEIVIWRGYCIPVSVKSLIRQLKMGMCLQPFSTECYSHLKDGTSISWYTDHRSSKPHLPNRNIMEYHCIHKCFFTKMLKEIVPTPRCQSPMAPRPKERWLKAAAAALTSFSPKAWGFMDWKHLSNWGTNHWGIEPSILRHFLVEYSGM